MLNVRSTKRRVSRLVMCSRCLNVHVPAFLKQRGKNARCEGRFVHVYRHVFFCLFFFMSRFSKKKNTHTCVCIYIFLLLPAPLATRCFIDVVVYDADAFEIVIAHRKRRRITDSDRSTRRDLKVKSRRGGGSVRGRFSRSP